MRKVHISFGNLAAKRPLGIHFTLMIQNLFNALMKVHDLSNTNNQSFD